MKSRNLAILAVISVLLLFFTGCSNGQKSGIDAADDVNQDFNPSISPEMAQGIYNGSVGPETLLKETCSFPVDLDCLDKQVFVDKIVIYLQNNAGRDIIVDSIQATSDALQSSCGMSTTTTFLNSKKQIFTLNGCNFNDTGKEKNVYEITFNFSWADTPTIKHSVLGRILVGKP